MDLWGWPRIYLAIIVSSRPGRSCSESLSVMKKAKTPREREIIPTANRSQ